MKNIFSTTACWLMVTISIVLRPTNPLRYSSKRTASVATAAKSKRRTAGLTIFPRESPASMIWSGTRKSSTN